MLRRLLLATTLALALPTLAFCQESPQATPTPYRMHAPSRPVLGPQVRRCPSCPNQKGPLPGVAGPKPPRVGIMIDGWTLGVPLGPCAAKVTAAIQCHADLFTGDKECDKYIAEAREFQERKEAEDPSYANEPRICPPSTPSNGQGPSNQ